MEETERKSKRGRPPKTEYIAAKITQEKLRPFAADPKLASEAGKKGKPSARKVKPRKNLNFADATKVKENILTLLGDLYVAAAGDWDKTYSIVKEYIRLAPKETNEKAGTIVMNFLKRMESKTDPVEAAAREDKPTELPVVEAVFTDEIESEIDRKLAEIKESNEST